MISSPWRSIVGGSKTRLSLLPSFCRRITAENYIFCANGEHDNPDLRVLELILDSRLVDDDDAAAGENRPFRFLFNSFLNGRGRGAGAHGQGQGAGQAARRG